MWQIKPKNIFTYGHQISLKSECNFRICKAKMYINETLVEFVNGNWWFIIKGSKAHRNHFKTCFYKKGCTGRGCFHLWRNKPQEEIKASWPHSLWQMLKDTRPLSGIVFVTEGYTSNYIWVSPDFETLNELFILWLNIS